ncbi:MAG: Ig-like domain-containing protein, partial [Candidatus Zixiibacteriota bacterium]
MRRFGCKYFLYTLLLIVLLSTSGVYAHPSEADTVNINSLSSQANAAQYYSDTVYTESGVQINDTIVIKANKNLLNGIKKKKKRKILLSLELIQGDGNLAIDISKKNKLIGYYNFIPDTSGIYTVEFLSVQTVSHPKHGIDPNIPPESTIYIYSYSVVTNSISSNQSPVIEDQYGFASLCNLNEPKSFQVTAFDAENDPLTYVKLSGSGSINSGTGLLTYTPDTSGVFTFEIAVYDAAGGDTAFVYDTILLNSPPVMSSNDSTVNLCQVEEICFDVFGFDFDGDTMQIFMLEGLGNFTSVNDSGRVCFMPADVDSATYQFVFRAADSCLLNFGLAPPSASESFQDTALITVIINQSPQIFCPGEQNFFDCVGGDFCFDISALDPDNDLLNYNIISNNATIVNQTVCITTIESVQLDVEIEVFDECGAADTCLVPVTIVVNQAPAVITAPDFDIFMCQSDTVCFSASVSDPDFNISSLLLNHGEYDQLVDSICFVPDTAGLYSFEFIAVDACNLADTSITNVNVVLNRTPEIFLGNDLTLDVCTNEEICITPSIVDYDDNIALVIPNFGLYNDLTGEVCFTPDSSGVYSLIVEAIDVCGVFDIDSLNININIKEAPFVSLGSNQSYFQCQSEEICIDINTIANYFDLQSNIGIINQLDNQVCFTPDTAGTYTLEVTVTDSCGFIASDTINIDVAFNNAPNISGFFDQEVYLCSPETICLPVTIDDVDGNLVTIDVNLGSYQNGQVCFVPYDSGNYEIIVTATDECGLQAVDTAVVHVLTDQAVNITVPGDTTFFVCELDTFCFPVYGIPENGVVTVTGINTWYNPVNSTICYYAECSSVNNITLTVNTPCNTIVKEFSVTVICNTNPLVILPPDTSYNLCTPAEICIPVGINDVDNNLESINVIGGSYDFISGNICINADTSGIYTIGVTAVDSCQASDYDEILVTVEVNSTPVCTVPNDTTIGLCTPSQISLPATVIDIDNNLTEFVIIEGPGSLVNGNWVYNAVIDESFMVVVRATDDCGFICEDTFNVVIEINGAPTCNITDNQTFFQCLPAEVAIPVNPVDPDNDPVQCYIISGPGEIINSFWVYTPTTSETVEVTIRCTDTCGLFCESTFSASFIINEAPVCDVPNDTNIFLCNIQEVSLPYSYTDNDGTPVTCEIISGSGQLLNGNWVYTPN